MIPKNEGTNDAREPTKIILTVMPAELRSMMKLSPVVPVRTKQRTSSCVLPKQATNPKAQRYTLIAMTKSFPSKIAL